jgi:DNA polymerase-3 subunit epsilon
MKWQEQELFAIDTETTGVERGKDRIVELGAYWEGEGGKRFGTLIDPGIPIPAEASAVHGITDETVAGKPKLTDILPRFLVRVHRATVLVGYNWPFDSEMLGAEIGDRWREAIEGKPVLDPYVVVRFDDVGRYWRGKGRHKLDAVAARYRLSRGKGSSHRASSDAYMAIRVLRHLARYLPEDAHEAAELIRRRREEQDARFQAWLAAQPPRDEPTDEPPGDLGARGV